jgi:hypothetical protein
VTELSGEKAMLFLASSKHTCIQSIWFKSPVLDTVVMKPYLETDRPSGTFDCIVWVRLWYSVVF